MSIIERVRGVAETLTPAERQLVKEVIAKPRDIALGTASELARRTGVHEATASRLARKLGFDSYADFRDAIRDEFIIRTDPATRVRKTLASADRSGLLPNLVDQEVEALTRLPDYVTEEQLGAVAGELINRRKIFIFATGNAETLAVLLNRRLRRMALDAVLLRGDGRDIAEEVLPMDRQDALILLAFRRQPRLYAPLVERTQKLRALTVAIADSIGPSLSPSADHLLSAPRSGTGDAFQTLTVPMAICNGLVLAIARSNGRKSLRYLESLGELLADFERR
jgi:DNA-binding MurR/RpiR family transcriptional regulator